MNKALLGPQYAGSVAIRLDDDDMSAFLEIIMGLVADGKACVYGNELWVHEDDEAEMREYLGIYND